MTRSRPNEQHVHADALENDGGVGAASLRPRLDLHARGTRDVMVISAKGDLDALTAPRLTDAINNALSVPSSALIVDLTDLDFLSSAGMAVLVAGHRAAAGTKQFCVVADGPVIARSITAVGLDTVLRLYANVDAALHDVR